MHWDNSSTSTTGLEGLRKCGSVNTFGAVCPTELGNKAGGRGSQAELWPCDERNKPATELCVPRRDQRQSVGLLAPYPNTKGYIWMKALTNDLFECVLLPGFPNCPISISTNPPGSFHTGDVFVPHATLPDRWKLIGRKDDVINVSFSESFVALPFEDYVRVHPLIDEAAVFGNGRPKLGLLVFGSEAAKGLIAEEVLDGIWERIEEMNKRNRPWTRVDREMVIVIPFGKELAED